MTDESASLGAGVTKASHDQGAILAGPTLTTALQNDSRQVPAFGVILRSPQGDEESRTFSTQPCHSRSEQPIVER